MALISDVSGVVPEYHYTRLDTEKYAAKWLEGDPSGHALMKRFLSSCGVEARNFVLPIEEILTLGMMGHRAELFEELAPSLACQAADQVLNKINRQEISAVIVTSCSCPTIPALDTLIVEKLGLSPNVTRIPVFQYGCIGGVSSLSLASRLANGGATVLVVACEICSLVFQAKNHAPSQLLGASLFGDGAAAAIIRPDASSQKGIRIVSTQSYIIPNTREIMGYDTRDDGLHLRLDRALPEQVIQSADKVVREFIEKESLELDDIALWLLHPGGPKILRMFSEVFKIPPAKIEHSFRVLKEYGNTSSASVLFVLREALKEKLEPGQKAIMLGIGPGLCIEAILLSFV